MWAVILVLAYAVSILMVAMSAATIAAAWPVRRQIRIGALTVGRVYDGREAREFRDAGLALLQSGLTVYLTTLMTRGGVASIAAQLGAYVVSLLTTFYLLRDTVGALPIFLRSSRYLLFATGVATLVPSTVLAILLFMALVRDNQVVLDYRSGDRAAESQQCVSDRIGAMACFYHYSWDLRRFPGYVDSTYTVTLENENPLKSRVAKVRMTLPGADCPVSWSAWGASTPIGGTGRDTTYGHVLSVPVGAKTLRLTLDWSGSRGCVGEVSLDMDVF
jgi:hypothetical protein